MPLRTTTIGAFPKPDEVQTVDWFSFPSTTGPEATVANREPADPVEVLDRATRSVVVLQTAAGIDIPTDGEVRRENYVHYHCRHLDGIDFERLTERTLRAGAWIGQVPTFTGAIRTTGPFLPRDWSVAQAATDKPVKITMPGPLTIMDTTADAYYRDDRAWGRDLADALNEEARALADVGCRNIQIDEPVFARYPSAALDYGFELLERVFDGLDPEVTRICHMCCGYPDRLNSTSYEKADPAVYRLLAPAVEDSSIDVISLEDAHRHNDTTLFELFHTTTVVLGAVGIAASRVESPAEISARVMDVLEHIDAERLMIGPDCGLAMLPTSVALAKLESLVEAAWKAGG